MIDSNAARELRLYIVNEAALHPQHQSILKNLATKKVRSLYKHDLAVKLFGYLVEAGAKKYHREHGTLDVVRYGGQPWHKLFDAGTRKAVAEDLTRSFEAEFDLGNYDYLLPKKYQKEMMGVGGKVKFPSKHHSTKKHSAHSTKKKVTWRTPESIKIAWSPMNQAWLALWPGKGSISDQQVLKMAGTDEMCAWLRETYGDPYGCSSRSHHARRKTSLDLHRDLHDPRVLKAASDRQLQGFYSDEKRDVAKARAEATRRGLTLHARQKKSPSQLDREIAERVPAWTSRGGRR